MDEIHYIYIITGKVEMKGLNVVLDIASSLYSTNLSAGKLCILFVFPTLFLEVSLIG